MDLSALPSWAQISGSVIMGALSAYALLKKLGREGATSENDIRKDEQKRLLELLDKLQSSQTKWMQERGALHDENLALKTELEGLRHECFELRSAINQLKEQVSKFEHLDSELWSEHYSRAPFAVLRVGADGSVLDANEQSEMLLGYPESQFKRMTFQEFTHPEDLESDLEMVKECLSGKRVRYTMLKRYRKANGEWVRRELHVITHFRNGIFRYFTSFLLEDGAANQVAVE